MLGKISPKNRRNILLAITTLTVTYVRTMVQYHRLWETFTEFIGSWMVHSFAVFLLITFTYAILNNKSAYFLGKENENHEVTIDETIVYTSLIIVIASIMIYFIALMTPSGDYFD